MGLKKYTLTPRDLLLFRDGRPIDRVKDDKSDIAVVGHGANWPRPDHLYNAVMHALIGDRMAGGKAFGKFPDLKVSGPFPCKDGEIHLPRPLDWKMHVEKFANTDLNECGLARPSDNGTLYGFLDDKEGKKDYLVWIPYAAYKAYLAAKTRGEREALPWDCDETSDTLPRPQLFKAEIRTGTTLDPKTGASARTEGVTSGQYRAEYLRLVSGVSMICEIDTGTTGKPVPSDFIMGGQGGIVHAAESKEGTRLEELFPSPSIPDGDGPFFVRWTLLTPAYFANTGWLPGWCRDTRKTAERRPDGDVMLKGDDGVYLCEKGVRLVGVCTGKPIVFSGWDGQSGVKPTRLAVPAGSVYLFRCPDRTAATGLVTKLHLTRQSDFGSQVFGMGVCSSVPVE